MATIRNEPKITSFVSCPACSCEIPLEGAARLPAEFSVPCPSCRRRTVYQAAAAHDSKKAADATNTFGRARVPAGMKTSKKTPAMPPKSWLNECATWLLQ